MLETFWLKKRVFITGHTGFKGSWLSHWLQTLGADVTGYSLAPTSSPNMFDITDVASGMHSVMGDILDSKSLQRELASAQPEIVFHLAAQPLVLEAFSDPVKTYSTNVLGTINLFEAVRTINSVRAIVNVTTDKCYQNTESKKPFREEDPLGGSEAYSSSKACSELVSRAYRDSYFGILGIGLATARAGNVIGGGDWCANRLVPDTVTSFIKGKKVQIRNPKSVRPWQHVTEPIRGYLVLAQRLFENPQKFAQGWNFGPRQESMIEVDTLVKLMMDLWKGNGEGLGWEVKSNTTVIEHETLRLDVGKASRLLEWRPILSITEAMKYTLDWYQHFFDSNDMRELTLSQIQSYTKRVFAKHP